MSDKYGIVFVECMSFKPHKAHSWREGILWHRKRTCSGRPMTEAELWRAANPSLGGRVKNEFLPPHKHSFVLQLPNAMSFLNPEKTIWNCKGCGLWVSVDRDVFHKVLLNPWQS